MEEKKLPDKITIHNKILESYKTYHVDGAFGGITPKGLISLSFFAERFPIPKSSDFKVDKEGRLSEKLIDDPDSKTGIIREYEAGIYMDIATAKEVIKLLTNKVQEIEKIKNI